MKFAIALLSLTVALTVAEDKIKLERKYYTCKRPFNSMHYCSLSGMLRNRDLPKGFKSTRRERFFFGKYQKMSQ